MTFMAGMLLFTAEATRSRLLGGGWIAVIVTTSFALFAGNLVAATPFAVELEEGKGLCLRAPFKKLYVPIEEVREVRSGLLEQGTIVKLNRRHGLMKSFNIHWAFGEQGRNLARALELEISRRE